MSDRLIKTIAFDGTSRALIVQRDDGHYSYRMQGLWEVDGRAEWSPPGPYGGVYSSPEMAEHEARARKATRSN